MSTPAPFDTLSPPSLSDNEFRQLIEVPSGASLASGGLQPSSLSVDPITEAQFRQQIELEVPAETPLTPRMSQAEIEQLVRNSKLRPEVIRAQQEQRMNDLTGGAHGQAVLKEQIRQNLRDSTHPGGADWAPPTPKAWYEKP